MAQVNCNELIWLVPADFLHHKLTGLSENNCLCLLLTCTIKTCIQSHVHQQPLLCSTSKLCYLDRLFGYFAHSCIKSEKSWRCLLQILFIGVGKISKFRSVVHTTMYLFRCNFLWIDFFLSSLPLSLDF